MVYVNDQLKGESPVAYDFVWYGWHRLTVRKEGFERLDDRKLLRAPVWFWIPFDLAMELLPFPIRDDRTWSYTLTPTTELPTPMPPAPAHETEQPGPAITNPRTEQPPAPPTRLSPETGRAAAIESKQPGPAPAKEAPPAPSTPTTEETHDGSR